MSGGTRVLDERGGYGYRAVDDKVLPREDFHIVAYLDQRAFIKVYTEFLQIFIALD